MDVRGRGTCYELYGTITGMVKGKATALSLAGHFLEVLIIKRNFHLRVGLRALN